MPARDDDILFHDVAKLFRAEGRLIEALWLLPLAIFNELHPARLHRRFWRRSFKT